MKLLLSRLLGRAGDFSNVQPLSALFLGGAMLAVFLAVTLRRGKKTAEPRGSGLLWMLYHESGLFLWALFLVTCLLGGVSALRSYLHQTVANFDRTHGRVTQANYDSVQTTSST